LTKAAKYAILGLLSSLATEFLPAGMFSYLSTQLRLCSLQAENLFS
jgi:hypothetical protein